MRKNKIQTGKGDREKTTVIIKIICELRLIKSNNSKICEWLCLMPVPGSSSADSLRLFLL